MILEAHSFIKVDTFSHTHRTYTYNLLHLWFLCLSSSLSYHDGLQLALTTPALSIREQKTIVVDTDLHKLYKLPLGPLCSQPSNDMSAIQSSNPPTRTESKSAKKKKAKAEAAAHSPAPAEPDASKLPTASEPATNGAETSAESPYIRELQK